MKNYIDTQVKLGITLIPVALVVLGSLMKVGFQSELVWAKLYTLAIFICSFCSMGAGILAIAGFASIDNPLVKRKINKTLILERSQEMVSLQVGFLFGAVMWLLPLLLP